LNKKLEQKLIVKTAEVGLRLDVYLSNKLDITRSKAQKLVRNNLVFVGKETQNSKYLLSKGDKISVFEAKKATTPSINIIFEDNDLIVIDKPAGITSHPAPGESDITIAEVFFDKYSGKQNTDRDMIVHRLDKGTSGLMVLARNEKTRAALVKQFADRKVNKTYAALVHGRVVPKEGIIDMPLSRDIRSKNRMSPADEGKDAKTIYKVDRYFKGFTLVSTNPKTGRTHQIRAHFVAIGHPLYGDERYGIKEDNFKRIFLHAAEISFIHPSTGKRVKFISPLPPELTNIISKLEIE